MRHPAGHRRTWTIVSVVVLVLVLVAGIVAVQYSLDNQIETSGSAAPAEGGRAFLRILGGVRDTVAAVFWNKTNDIYEKYWHGNLVKDAIVYPYYWLIISLNPHFEQAYYYASYMLCQFGKADEGFNLALQGVKNNPQSALLQASLAQIYYFYKHDARKALYHIDKAIAIASQNGDQATDKAGLEDVATYTKFRDVVQATIDGKVPIPPPPETGMLNGLKQLDKD